MLHKKNFQGEDTQIYTDASTYDNQVGGLTLINGTSTQANYKRSKLEVYLLQAFRETLVEAGYTIENHTEYDQCIKIEELGLELQVFALTYPPYLMAMYAVKYTSDASGISFDSLMGPQNNMNTIQNKNKYNFTITIKGNADLLQLHMSTYNNADADTPVFLFCRGIQSIFSEEEYGVFANRTQLTNLLNDNNGNTATFTKYFNLQEDGATIRSETRTNFYIDRVGKNTTYIGMDKLDNLHYVLTNLTDVNFLYHFKNVYYSYNNNMKMGQFYRIGGDIYYKVNAFMVIRV